MKMQIHGCHELSVRRDPSNPEPIDDTIETVKPEDILEVDTNSVVWDWHGHKYYFVKTPNDKVGYAVSSGLKPI